MTRRKDEGKDPEVIPELGISRRNLLKRGAIAGGTLLWVAPVIKSLTPPAFAGETSPNGGDDTCCCACYNRNNPSQGFCVESSTITTDAECRDACRQQFQSAGVHSFGCNQECVEEEFRCAHSGNDIS